MAEVREIKFRAKPECENEWVFGDLIHYTRPRCEKTTIKEREGFQLEHDVVEDTVCQFTGMRDKEGKEIYENDIVEVYDFTSVYAEKYRGIVVFFYGSWCVEYFSKIFEETCKPRLFFDDFADRKTVVLGNKFDNPELLKAEKI